MTRVSVCALTTSGRLSKNSALIEEDVPTDCSIEDEVKHDGANAGTLQSPIILIDKGIRPI